MLELCHVNSPAYTGVKTLEEQSIEWALWNEVLTDNECHTLYNRNTWPASHPGTEYAHCYIRRTARRTLLCQFCGLDI